MYRISTKDVRKYSTTPIVEVIVVNGKEEEKFLCVIAMPKKQGDEFSAKVVELLNKNI